jgi:hypothetical protein
MGFVPVRTSDGQGQAGDGASATLHHQEAGC